MINLSLAILLALVGIVCYIKYNAVATQFRYECSNSADLLTKLLTSEQLRIAAQTELNFLKQSIQQMMDRPVVAMINEQQMQTIANAIMGYVATLKDPKLAN